MSQLARVPKHLWIIGIITLLWNLVGAYDYLMTQTHNETYMAGFDQAQLDFFYGFPTWLEVFWALAVWGGVLGSVLLLLRKCLALPVFVVSFVSMTITAVHNFGLSNGMDVMGAEGLAFTVVIFLVALGLVIYSWLMRRQGVIS